MNKLNVNVDSLLKEASDKFGSDVVIRELSEHYKIGLARVLNPNWVNATFEKLASDQIQILESMLNDTYGLRD